MPTTRKVSSALRRAGFTSGYRYTQFGYVDGAGHPITGPGLHITGTVRNNLMRTEEPGPEVRVVPSGRDDEQRAMIPGILDALTAAGINARQAGPAVVVDKDDDVPAAPQEPEPWPERYRPPVSARWTSDRTDPVQFDVRTRFLYSGEGELDSPLTPEGRARHAFARGGHVTRSDVPVNIEHLRYLGGYLDAAIDAFGDDADLIVEVRRRTPGDRS